MSTSQLKRRIEDLGLKILDLRFETALMIFFTGSFGDEG
jgi:hypothetical protein